MVKPCLLMTSTVIASLFFNFEAHVSAETLINGHTATYNYVNSDMEVVNIDDARLLNDKFLQTGEDVYLQQLKHLAEANNAEALVILGDIYSSGVDIIDGNLAVFYYEKAADLGKKSAIRKLGELYRKGNIVPIDKNKAKLYLGKASESGSIDAQIRLASILIEEDSSLDEKSRGLDMLKSLSESGDKVAPMILGDFYSLDAANFDKAINFYEKAASAGNINALVKLGRAYRDGDITEPNNEKAIGYLNAAAEEGNATAYRILASDHLNKRFGSLSNPRIAVSLYEKAIAAGDAQSFNGLASIYLNGLGGIRKDTKKAIDMYVAGAKLGNPNSIKSLVRIYRNGRGKEVPKNTRKAEQVLDQYGNALNDEDKTYELSLLKASRAGSLQEFESVFNDISALPNDKKIQFINNVRSSNGNAYTFIIQRALNQKGLYKGRMNGYMNNDTIVSINNYCKSVGVSRQCIKGPLHWATSMAIAENLFSDN